MHWLRGDSRRWILLLDELRSRWRLIGVGQRSGWLLVFRLLRRHLVDRSRRWLNSIVDPAWIVWLILLLWLYAKTVHLLRELQEWLSRIISTIVVSIAVIVVRWRFGRVIDV